MKLVWKNRGILVPIYLAITAIAVILLLGILQKYVGGVFLSGYDYKINLGIIILISGAWTYLTSEDYVKKDGKKVKVKMENEFFGIPMKIWGYIKFIAGTVVLILGITGTLKK